MNTGALIAVVAVILAAGAAGWFAFARPAHAPAPAVLSASSTLPVTAGTDASSSAPASVSPGSSGASSGSGTPQATGGIRGTVTLGPTCPVEQNPPASSCADKPYAASLLAVNQATGAKTAFRSAADGSYSVALPAGTYLLENASSAMLPRLSPVTVTVHAQTWTTVALFFDTGIRSATPPPAGDTTMITPADNGKTVTLALGQRVGIAMGNSMQWDLAFDPDGILTRVTNIATIVGEQGVYTAAARGTTILHATGRPICDPGQACPMYVAVTDVTIVVQ